MKKKKAFALSGTVAVGTLVVAAPLSSIANEEVLNEEEPLFQEEPTVEDVEGNPNFVINTTVDGSKLTLTWNEVEGAEQYIVAKYSKIDTEYVVEKEQTVETTQFEDSINNTDQYLYRIVPVVDGEVQVDNVGVLKFTLNNDVPVSDEDELPEEGEPTEETVNQEPTEEVEEENTEEVEEEEENTETEEPTEEVEEEEKTETQEPTDETVLELTDGQLDEIDQLAQEFVGIVVSSQEFQDLHSDFVGDLESDREFLAAFATHFNDVITPYIEEKALEIDLSGDLEQQITELENETNQLILEFFQENEQFNQHVAKFEQGVTQLSLDLEYVYDDYETLVTELVDESLVDEAQEEFSNKVNEHLYSASNDETLKHLDDFMEALEDALENPEEPTDKEPVDKEPVDKEPTDKEPTDKEPTDKEPTDKEPVDKEPTDKEPTDKEPTDKEPVDKEPTDKEPVDKEPTDKEPVDKEPTDKEPVDKEPTDKEPVDKEPVDEEPTDKEPTDKEPTDDKTPVGGNDNNTNDSDNYEDQPKGNVNAPTVPKTGDGSIQKVVSPLIASLLAIAVAFVLTPSRVKRKSV